MPSGDGQIRPTGSSRHGSSQACSSACSSLSRLRAQALPWNEWLWPALGCAIGLAGVALRWWAIRTLGAHFTRNLQTATDHRLITNGPYRHLRHPSYTGAILMLTGVGVGLGNALSIIACLLLSATGFVRRIPARRGNAAGRTRRALRQVRDPNPPSRARRRGDVCRIRPGGASPPSLLISTDDEAGSERLLERLALRARAKKLGPRGRCPNTTRPKRQHETVADQPERGSRTPAALGCLLHARCSGLLERRARTLAGQSLVRTCRPSAVPFRP